MTPEFILASLLLSSTWMAAVSWYVQLVHYPHFLYVEERLWTRSHKLHVDRTSLLVVPPMLLQMFSTVMLFQDLGWPGWFAWVSLLLLLGSVGWTGAVCGPIQVGLKATRDTARIRALLRANWVRTVCWTAQAFLAWLVTALYL